MPTRWRETAVVTLRAAAGPRLGSMLQLIRESLTEAVDSLRAAGLTVTNLESNEAAGTIGLFPWPAPVV
jgi:biotin operon repressor